MSDKPESPAAILARKRWAKTTPEERSQYARKAAQARWGKRKSLRKKRNAPPETLE